MEKISFRVRVLFIFFHHIPDGRADADHGSDRKNQIVKRQHEIQCRDTISTDCHGNKVGISENINRHADHTEHVLGNVFYKFF